MFGARYYGNRYYGPRYWGNGSDTPAAAVTRRRHFAAIIASGGYALVMWILGG